MSGIYIIASVATGRSYVGSSADVETRLAHHRAALKRGKHMNRFLQSAWTRHGESTFEFNVVEEVAVADLPTREQHHLDRLAPNVFNLGPCADAPTRGVPKSPEHRAKIGAAHLGRRLSTEHVAKIRARVVTPETRAKISAARKGKPLSAAHCAAIAAGQTGRHHSTETRQRMRQSQLGHGCSDETRAKIGATKIGNTNCLGRTHHAETRAKIGAANKGRTPWLGRKHSAETIERMRIAAQARVAKRDQEQAAD